MSNELDRDFAPLFEQAEREGLWFCCHYQDIWCSPSELREHHKNGRYRWGIINWELRKPAEHLAELERFAKTTSDNVAAFKKRITP
jgi:hypothetical protein